MTTSKGLIFDIKRFALHDGEGIRSTVFMKGCPLRCRWCQNPEGLSVQRNLLYMEKNCIHCKQCVQAATKQGIIMKEDRLIIDREAEEDWDAIVDRCPTRALRWDSRWMDEAELERELMKDEVFFRHGGGVTFSGGEPLNQKDVLLRWLKFLHEQKIHTAIETSLYTDVSVIKEAVMYLDQIYCDYKIAKDALHTLYTGCSNQKIKENLKWLLESPAAGKVIVRTPLIPGITATEENITAVASDLAEWNPDVRYELLNYNPLARAKYKYLDKEYGLDPSLPVYSKSEMNTFKQWAQRAGIRHIISE